MGVSVLVLDGVIELVGVCVDVCVMLGVMVLVDVKLKVGVTVDVELGLIVLVKVGVLACAAVAASRTRRAMNRFMMNSTSKG